jgi:HNH endonuclease
MKNSKRNATGVSKRSLGRKSTADGQYLKVVDARSLWKQVEDVVVPRLRLPVIDRVVYMHLLRHSHLEGKRRLRFSILWLSRNINLTMRPTRDAVRRLAAQGVLRFVERTSLAGHVVDVRLPAEVRGVRARAAARAREAARKAAPTDIEEVDFMKTIDLRRAIHSRERGRCFYCLRRVALRSGCLDHVVPRARVECNSYRNLVSACMECNAQKADQPAEEYLRWLFREHRLGAAELRGRFEALELLAAGKLRPAVGVTREGRRSRPRLRKGGVA